MAKKITNISIEKSVSTSFEVLNLFTVRSMIDFGKLFFRENTKMK